MASFLPQWAALSAKVQSWFAYDEPRRPWHDKPLNVFVLYLFIEILWYWEVYIPSPGKAVAALGVAAALMTLREGMSGKEKLAWTVLLFGFLALELTSIDTERKATDEIRVVAREQEIKHFSDIAAGITASIDNSKNQFSTTMARSDHILGGLDETLKAQTGGNSFCYYGTSAQRIYLNGVKLTPLAVGKYPLSGIQARIVDIRYTQRTFDDTGGTIVKTIPDLGFLANAEDTTLGPESIFVPFKDSEGKHDLNIFFDAKNGHWLQASRFRLINGRWTMATVVIGRFASRKRKLLFKSVDPDFPREELDQSFRALEKMPKLY